MRGPQMLPLATRPVWRRHLRKILPSAVAYEMRVQTLPSGKVMPLPMTKVAFTSLGPPLAEKSIMMSSPLIVPTAFHCARPNGVGS